MGLSETSATFHYQIVLSPTFRRLSDVLTFCFVLKWQIVKICEDTLFLEALNKLSGHQGFAQPWEKLCVKLGTVEILRP